MKKATQKVAFSVIFVHFVFAPKNHISFLQSCAFGFAVITWDNNRLIEKIITAIEKHNAAVYDAEKKIEPLSAIEKEQIATAIKNADGNITKAAKLLGISRRTLYNKIQKYEL